MFTHYGIYPSDSESNGGLDNINNFLVVAGRPLPLAVSAQAVGQKMFYSTWRNMRRRDLEHNGYRGNGFKFFVFMFRLAAVLDLRLHRLFFR